jgi:hypothetical protein
MGYYINCLKQSAALQRDIKELIPNMNLRRRMSRVVKMGVSTAMESLIEFDEYGTVDAIITSTWLGCIADSEKFLANIIADKEQMLNPTPFIQSTFNTVGAQIALIRSLKCYNNTFTHRDTSFESILIDAMLRLDSGCAKAVLVGVFDEVTPTVEIILNRLGISKGEKVGEGAVFFVITKERLACSVAAIEALYLDSVCSEQTISTTESCDAIWCGSVAEVLAKTLLESVEQTVYITNDIHGKNHSVIKLKCL